MGGWKEKGGLLTPSCLATSRARLVAALRVGVVIACRGGGGWVGGWVNH